MHTEGKIKINSYNTIVSEGGKTLSVGASLSIPNSIDPLGEPAANAARIVKAWNMHDELVETIKDFVENFNVEDSNHNAIMERAKSLLQQAK